MCACFCEIWLPGKSLMFTPVLRGEKDFKHLVFVVTIFLPQMIAFSLLGHTLRLTKLGIYITPAKKCHNILSSSVSTTRWRYNPGKCVLPYNSHILYRTFNDLIYTSSLNCAESRDVDTFPPTVFCSQIREMSQTYFSELLPGNFTNLHETLHTVSVDPPDKNLLNQFGYFKQFKLLK